MPWRSKKKIRSFSHCRTVSGTRNSSVNGIDRKKVMLGVTGQGATFLGPGHVRHAGRGKTFIGVLDPGVSDRAAQVARMFCEADIETEVSANIHDLIRDKLLVNVGINALTALTGAEERSVAGLS